MRFERLSFFIASIQPVAGGWRLEGEPGYDRQYWARPGDRFDRALNEDDGDDRVIDLVVVDLNESSVVLTGRGGDLLRPNDIVSGERPVIRSAG
ncbi:hypothetical protein [Actinoplanes subtropicus]|uniref:hypothetical protein n=1 Tax=Actinoplanes subtropicus TaxID=543632 RepID=UPI0012F97418|nr:hypothetical protein [Actinoplanes subtropicus]